MKQELATIWQNFVEDYTAQLQTIGFAQFSPDPDWPSPCIIEVDGQPQWRPVKQTQCGENNNFANVESAMSIKIDAQFQTFFSLYFSDNLLAQHGDGELEFLQAWSQDDFTRLQQNLIGHLMMKQRLKQAPTLFFALTDEEDLNLVVDNTTGHVCLEYVGKEPHKVVSKDLLSFITECKPSL